MRILFPHQNFVGSRHVGNARGVRTVAALIEAGCEVDLITADHTYLGVPVTGPTSATEGPLSIRRIAVPDCGTKIYAYARFQAGVLARRLPKPTAVLATTPPLPGLAVALALCARWRVPLILEIRDLWPAFLVQGGVLGDGAATKALEVLELAAVSLASGVISVSPGFEPYLRTIGAQHLLTFVSGMDPTFMRLHNSERPSRFQIVYTGSLNEAYDIGRLAQLARRGAQRGWRVTVAGAGRGAAAFRNAPDVDFLGPLARHHLPAVLHSAHVGINAHAQWPLLGTTLTGKLFDYVAAGLPVLEAAGGAMGALVDHLGAGVRSGRTCDEMLDTLDRLETDWASRERMSAAGTRALSGPLCADHQARRMAASVIAMAGRGDPITPRRLATAFAAATVRVARREPSRALASAYGRRPHEVAAAAMRRWLKELEWTDGVSPLAIPSIL